MINKPSNVVVILLLFEIENMLYQGKGQPI